MKLNKHYYLMISFALAVLLSLSAKAEQKQELGNWDVHYMAFTSTFLTPQVAKEYGLVRSKFNGIINISVLDKQDKAAQSVVLSGEAKNLLGVTKQLKFKQVTEGKAIYYLAVLPFSDQEQYRIFVDINNGLVQKTLKFQHKFYAE